MRKRRNRAGMASNCRRPHARHPGAIRRIEPGIHFSGLGARNAGSAKDAKGAKGGTGPGWRQPAAARMAVILGRSAGSNPGSIFRDSGLEMQGPRRTRSAQKEEPGRDGVNLPPPAWPSSWGDPQDRTRDPFFGTRDSKCRVREGREVRKRRSRAGMASTCRRPHARHPGAIRRIEPGIHFLVRLVRRTTPHHKNGKHPASRAASRQRRARKSSSESAEIPRASLPRPG